MIEQLYQRWIIPGFETRIKQRNTYAFWEELEESQWWPLEELQALQLSRLRSLLAHCFEHSRYYREQWQARELYPAKLDSLEEFAAWPVMQREMVRDQREQIQVNHDFELVHKSTGGSSGVPLHFVIDRRANEQRMAAANRGYAWAGAFPGTKQTHLWGITLGTQSKIRKAKEKLYYRYLYRRDMLDSFGFNMDSVDAYVRRINRYRPTAIVAYSNPLYCLARMIEQRGLFIHSPKSIVVGAEKIHAFQRKQIERVFNTPVYETYGSREFTLIGAECEHHTGLHLTMENLLTEIVNDDGTPTPDGQEGNVVITDLTNYAMPFVRYAIGDRAIAGLGACKCGRGLPLLPKVVGRRLDVIVTADGGRIAGEFFPHLIKNHTSILQFQVVQPKLDLVELRIVVDHRWTQEKLRRLQREISKAVGRSTQIAIQQLESIPLTPAGKLQVVVSHVKLDATPENTSAA